MEDQGEDWEIQEYSSSDVSNSKVRWIPDKGLSVGKKIVITAVVVSSAPLILPPLVVISALVYALSIPCGLVLASYTCIEKLMSKLVPVPKFPLMLGDETLAIGELEEFGFGGDIMEEAEKVQMEDMGEYCREGDENNYEELVEEINDENVKDWGHEEHVGEYLESKADAYGHKSTEKEDEELTNAVAEIVKEVGYEKDACEDLDGKDPVDDVHQVQVVVGKTGDVIAAGVVERGRGDKENTCNEKEDLARGTTGLLEDVRDESDPVGKDKQQTKETSETEKDVDQQNLAIAAGMEKPSEKGTRLGKLIGKTEGGKKRNKGPEINHELLEGINPRNVHDVYGAVEQVVETGSTIEIKKGEMNPQKVVVVEEPIVKTNRPMNGNVFVKAPDINGAGTEFSHTTNENLGVYQNISSHTPEITEGSLKLHVLAEVPESKCVGIETVEPDSKVPLSEKKIRERIEALRSIVGYKAEPRATCVEEIEALYIFTGVVPPAASFEYRSDPVEMMERLQFLMSIVGVK